MLNFGIVASGAATTAGLGNWDLYTPTTGGVLYEDIVFGNGTAVFGSDNVGETGYSTTPTTSITAGGTAGTEGQMFFEGGKFYRVDRLTGAHRLAYSDNGISWASAINVSSQTGDAIYSIAHGSGVWVAPVFGDNDVYTSTNGTAFTLQSGVLASANWNNSTWNGTVFGVYVGTKPGATGSTSYYTSTNGTTWTARTLPAAPLGEVKFGGDRVMYVAAAGVIYTSTSGTAFSVAGTVTTANLNTDPTRLLAYGSGVWVYGGNALTGGQIHTYYSTTNGATWATATFPTETDVDRNIAFDGVNAFYVAVDKGSSTNLYKAVVS